MTITRVLEDLLRHMEWADALVWTAVLSSPTAASDCTLRERLYHVHATQHAFLQVWLGTGGDRRSEGFTDSAMLARWAREYYAQVPRYASTMTAEGLGSVVPDSVVEAARARLGPGKMAPTMGETVLQVATHSMHHRGQICTRLRELGCEPPLTEYFVWVWTGRPNADWPAAVS